MTILLFLAVLFVLVLVHELGHFVVAKWTGMRVDEFGIGFPPRIFGVRYGETVYSLNALPIGGFVRIFGEDLQEAQSGSDTGRAFTDKNRWAQSAVLVAGVMMNVLFAFAIYAAVYVTGVPTLVDADDASPDAALVVQTVVPESPAAEAGLPLGASLTSVTAGNDTLATRTPDAFATFIAAHTDDEITLTYHDGDMVQSVTMVPSADVIESDTDRPAVGIGLALVDTIHYPVHEALVKAGETTWSVLSAITVGITHLLVDAVTLNADLSDVAGPVGIVSMVGDAADFGFVPLLLFTALISLNLAIINLLPIPALDGGRLLFVAIEAIRRRPINPAWAGRANLIGFAVLILLMLAVTFNDVARLI